MKMKFSDLPKGQAVLFNGQYAIKQDSKTLFISRLGVDGFHHMKEDEMLEIIEEADNGNKSDTD